MVYWNVNMVTQTANLTARKNVVSNNQDNPYYDKYYNMPKIYVPQVTSEICAFSADK